LSVAHKVVAQGANLVASNQDFDWLGPGIYFWESDPKRAMERAQSKVQRGSYKTAAVVGAVIDLSNCLDLVARQNLELVRKAYHSFVELQRQAALPLPVNKDARAHPNSDRLFRYLDCAVIKYLHEIIQSQTGQKRSIEPFDTVRGMFTEGAELYPGSGFKERSHVQIAVRSLACIKGVFIPKNLDVDGAYLDL
jgi:hypothetical protein